MSERYDNTAARHYAAYRPPLHRLILERVICPNESFRVGLDVGCGTGYSAVALTDFCDRVFGIDPSRAMLDVAQRHPKVSYFQGSGDLLGQIPVQQFDAVTFAGSLFYAKTDQLRRELVRVCPPGGTLIAYDFQILLDAVMTELGAVCPADSSHYDYEANIADWTEFEVDRSGRERIQLAVTERQMAHLLLSDSHRFDALARRYTDRDPFESLVGSLNSRVAMHLEADIYFTRYRVLER